MFSYYLARSRAVLLFVKDILLFAPDESLDNLCIFKSDFSDELLLAKRRFYMLYAFIKSDSYVDI